MSIIQTAKSFSRHARACIASRVYPTCVIITVRNSGSARIAGIHLLAKKMDRRIKSGDDDGASQRSAGPCFCQATGPPVFFFPLQTEGAERRQAHQPFHACEARRASCETRSPLGAPPRRFWPPGLLQPPPGPTFRPPDPAGFRLRSSGGDLPTMAGPRSRAGQHPEAPGDGLRDHPQAPHPLRQSRRL